MPDLYMLDTNGASELFSGKSPAHVRAAMTLKHRGDVIAISVVTKAELMFGFVKKPEATRVRSAFEAFLKQTSVLPWDERAATSYAEMRNHLRLKGKVLSTMDLLIAAHAHSLGAKIVTRDGAFQYVADMVEVVDWATK